MLAALSELDDSTANVQCVQALSSAAQRLSASMDSGAQLSRHLLCQVCDQACVISAHSQVTWTSSVLHCIAHLLPPGVLAELQARSTEMSLLVQIVASVAKSKMLQKDFKPLLIMSIAALEPELDECRFGSSPCSGQYTQ